MGASKEPVRLRKRKLPTGLTTLYLDIYRDGQRTYEYLKMYLVPEKTKADREAHVSCVCCPQNNRRPTQKIMQKILLSVFIAFAVILTCEAQDRMNEKPASLSYKSKEIKSALYWQQSSKTGQWESRKNTALVYLGEGVFVDNFYCLFIGEYKGVRYLFMDFRNYKWRYPTLQTEWTIYRTMIAAQLTEEDYSKLSSLSPGEELAISPRFYHDIFKGHREYSFPFYIKLGETLRSSSETLYQSNKKAYGEDFAERQWKEDYPPIIFIVLKRVVGSDGRDVVRFALYPHAMQELIDKYYFEVDYLVYRNLLTEDKKQTYK